jgi:hypothetical protein
MFYVTTAGLGDRRAGTNGDGLTAPDYQFVPIPRRYPPPSLIPGPVMFWRAPCVQQMRGVDVDWGRPRRARVRAARGPLARTRSSVPKADTALKTDCHIASVGFRCRSIGVGT